MSIYTHTHTTLGHYLHSFTFLKGVSIVPLDHQQVENISTVSELYASQLAIEGDGTSTVYFSDYVTAFAI
jgi:hypothetical protein